MDKEQATVKLFAEAAKTERRIIIHSLRWIIQTTEWDDTVSQACFIYCHVFLPCSNFDHSGPFSSIFFQYPLSLCLA